MGTSPSLQAYLSASDTIDVYIDSDAYMSQRLPNGVAVEMAGSTAHLVFDHGFTVSATPEGGRLSVRVKMESSLQDGQYEGLLGDFDGVAANDIVLQSGDSLNPSTATNSEYQDFVESCTLAYRKT